MYSRNVLGEHGVNPLKDSLDQCSISAWFSRLADCLHHLTSIPQNEDCKNWDGEKPDRAFGNICCGRGTALESMDNDVVVTNHQLL